MRERYYLFFGLRLISKEFHPSAIQTKIELLFGGIFSSNESAPANRKTGFYADRDPNKQESGVILHEAAQNFELLSSIQDQKLKIKNI
jgi:hypothetical protein